MSLGLIFLFAFIASFLFAVPGFRALAIRFEVVDKPDGVLKKHQKATPYLGGAALFCSLWLLLFLVNNCFLNNGLLWGLFTGLTIIFTAGLVDDLILLSPLQKFSCQVLSALVLVLQGFNLGLDWPFYLDQILALIWIVGLMNAFNLVDVMDGLATTLGFCVSFGLASYAFYLGQQDLLIILLTFMGALAAFFCYNAPRATIYLGDAGSMLIGTVIAVISLKINWHQVGEGSWLNYLIPSILAGIPIIEVGSLILIRKLKQIPFYNGSPDHFMHYLKNKKWSDGLILIFVALYSILLCAFSGLVAFLNLPIYLILVIGSLMLILWVTVVFCRDSFFP